MLTLYYTQTYLLSPSEALCFVVVLAQSVFPAAMVDKILISCLGYVRHEAFVDEGTAADVDYMLECVLSLCHNQYEHTLIKRVTPRVSCWGKPGYSSVDVVRNAGPGIQDTVQLLGTWGCPGQSSCFFMLHIRSQNVD